MPSSTASLARRIIALLSLPAALLLVSCQATAPGDDWAVPLTLKTFPPAYSARVTEIADTNRDGKVTLVEWVNAGGDERSFLLVDQNRDGTASRTELIRISSNAKFFDFTRRYADFNKDKRLTPREFRSASGVSVLRIKL